MVGNVENKYSVRREKQQKGPKKEIARRDRK